MILLSMTATFGCLQNETLELKPGLNLLERTNEGGKSTWCAFLRAMFYGLEARKGGALSERNRYTPWSGAPLRGSVDLVWEGRAITLRRFARGTDPFGGFEAVYTGTAQAVPGLTAANVGEALLGCTKEVFDRAVFIAQGRLWVDRSADLERRVAALASSGEEDVSFSQAQRRLKDWRNQRQSNRSTGAIPKLQARLDQLTGQLARVRDARVRAAQAAESLEQLELRRQEVRQDLDRHAAQAQLAYNRRYEKARADLLDAETCRAQLDREAQELGPRPGREALEDARDDLAVLRRTDPRRLEAKAELEAAQARLAALPAPGEALRVWLPLLLSALPALALGAAGLLGVLPLLPTLLPAALLLLAGLVFSLSGRRRRLARLAALDRARDGVEDAQRLFDALDGQCAQLYRRLTRLVSPFAPDAVTPDQLDAALDTALSLEARQRELDARLAAAQTVWEAVSTQGPPREVPPEALEDPRHTYDQDTARLRELDASIAGCQELLARWEGQALGVGDLDVLEAERAELQARLERQQAEFRALDEALSALDEAEAQLQSRFSPALNAQAGQLLSRLTGGKYAALTFTREFQALAQDDAGPHPAPALSQGTADQAYLALRLAVSLLTLPRDDPPPLVLDDALVYFDDRRLKLALDLLQDLAGTRQVLLFTCQDREGRALG